MNVALLGIVAYVCLQILIGFIVGRRVKTEEDYLVAGRRLGPGIAVFTIFATWFGAETCIGSAGTIYEDGLSGGTADPFGYAACLLFMGLFFAAALWRRRLTTLADLFRERYSVSVERLAVLIMVPGSVLWAAAQVRAFGQVLSVSGDLPLHLSIGIAAALVVVYTVAGGLMADAVTDVIQSVVLIGGLGFLTYLVFERFGSPGALAAAIEPARLELFAAGRGGSLEVLEAWAVPICGSVMAQELVVRISASRSATVARWSSLSAAFLYLGVGLMPVLIGLVGPRLLPGLAEGEQLLPRVAAELLPGALFAIFAGALVSALLSTVDSALLVASSLVSHNLVLPLRARWSEAAKVRVARAGVIVFAGIAYVLAVHAPSVHALVEQASGFGSAGIFVVAVAALTTGVGGRASALASLVSGVTVYVVASFVMGSSLPFLASLVAAASAYVLVAVLEWRLATRAAVST